MSDPFDEMDRVIREVAEKRAARLPELFKRMVDEFERRGYEVLGKTVEEIEDIISRPPTRKPQP